MNHSFVVSDDGISTWSKTASTTKLSQPNQSGQKEAKQSSGADNSALEKLILGEVNLDGQIADTANFTKKHNLTAEDIYPVLNSLKALEYLKLEDIESKLIELTPEGQSYATDGSPEYQFVTNIQIGEKVDMPTMQSRVGDHIAKIGFGKAMKQKWIAKDGPNFQRTCDNPVDVDQQ